MKEILIVSIGSFFGGSMRYWVSKLVQSCTVIVGFHPGIPEGKLAKETRTRDRPRGNHRGKSRRMSENGIPRGRLAGTRVGTAVGGRRPFHQYLARRGAKYCRV